MAEEGCALSLSCWIRQCLVLAIEPQALVLDNKVLVDNKICLCCIV